MTTAPMHPDHQKATQDAIAVRRALNAAIDALASAGDLAGAQALKELAVAQGYWTRPDQRPLHYLPDLPAQPVHDIRSSYVARYLEGHADAIAAEAMQIMGPTATGLSPVEEPLVGSGAWDIGVFYEGGMRNARVCDQFPKTAAIIDHGPEEIRTAGVVMFSWLHPGSHIVPHCGFSNARLRLHLGLSADTGARMRVADRTLAWAEGKSILFDDSFEHEVHHDGDRPRLILLVDLFHPALGAEGRAGFASQFGGDPKKKAGELLRGLGAQALAVAEDNRMQITFAPEQDRRIRRQMRDSAVRAIRIDEDGITQFEVDADHD